MKNDELIRAYFARLHLAVPEKLSPDADTLRKLHIRHVLTIPYENTDYLTGRIRSTAFETQFSEIILGGRGGMCIDMNPLFGELLTAIGYRVRYFSTRICSRKTEDINFHVISNVEDCDGQIWWCDVANPFTRFFEPLPLLLGEDLPASGSLFRFEEDSCGKITLFEKSSDDWRGLLAVRDSDITAEDRDRSKYQDVLNYPDNAIFSKEVFSILTPEGRRTLTGNLYRESYPGGVYRIECPAWQMPWAYAQFGLRKKTATPEESCNG